MGKFACSRYAYHNRWSCCVNMCVVYQFLDTPYEGLPFVRFLSPLIPNICKNIWFKSLVTIQLASGQDITCNRPAASTVVYWIVLSCRTTSLFRHMGLLVLPHGLRVNTIWVGCDWRTWDYDSCRRYWEKGWDPWRAPGLEHSGRLRCEDPAGYIRWYTIW